MRLYNLTIHELNELINSKSISVVELVNDVFKRIEEVEPKIDALVTVCKETAIQKAEKVQEKVRQGETISPLEGIPMAIKDVVCTKDILTTCGSKILCNFIPPYDATVMEKLNNEGAILIGKANMDEFAMGSSTENSYYKCTKNPWDLERVPGGSSGGAAAAVASGEAIFSLGSDTGGSIRQPASLCGIVGIRPTYGSVSRYGLVAYASSLDQIGPMTKDVTDCALVLNAIVGHDKKDSTSANIKHPDFTKSLINDVRGMRIAVPKEFFGEGINEDVKMAVLKARQTFEDLGAICEEISLPMTEYAIPAYYIIACAEASSNLARFDGVKYGYRTKNYDSLLDMYKKTRSEGFGAEAKRRIMLGTYALSSGYYDAYYKKAQQVRTLIIKEFESVFSKYDLVLCPVSPVTAFKIGEKSADPLEMYLADIYTVSLNIAGLPGMSIPCGFDKQGLPIGAQLMGKAFTESKLIRAAYTFEQNTDFHKKKPSI